MPRKNTIVPIEAFDPRLKTLLQDGCVKRVVIPCTSSEQRTALRNQLFDYRARSREQKIEGADTLYRAKITLGPIIGEADKRIYPLIIAPRGSEFDDVLSRVNVTDAVHEAAPTPDLLDQYKTED
jgi:hypothetical protein